LRFPALQHYETTTESWDGAEDSGHPAPTLVVSRSATPAGTARVPLASPGDRAGGAVTGTDDLARARADLALALALTALVALAGLGTLALLRRRKPRSRPHG
jgi:hypothetical protein